MDTPREPSSKIASSREAATLRADLSLLIQEYANDKQDILREIQEGGNQSLAIKQKIDALAWHGRCLSLLTVNQVQEALVLFKRSLLPTDNPTVRNTYIKTHDHRSNSIVVLSGILRTEALTEKMTLTSSRNFGNNVPKGTY